MKRINIIRRMSAANALLCIALLLAACGQNNDVEAFLVRHWSDPLPAQGPPPRAFTDLEASLAPEACGQCHVEQYAQWRTTLHSQAMGKGLRWQFDLMNQEESNKCMRCHAPLAEQKALVAVQKGWTNAPRDSPPQYVPPHLADSGLVCAACHLRGHRHFGPGRRANATNQPHAGFEAATAFQDSRFCAHCHQFPDEGARLGGKLREDTYRQWLASEYAGKQSCQNCHMPEGKHLWRGIHDPDMLRKALSIDLKLLRLPNGQHRAEVIARNTGAGHHLPTYLVPKIYLILQLNRPGQPPVELASDVIGWKADVAMTEEQFDTRIPAGASRHFSHDFQGPSLSGWEVELLVRVAPREHYERMFNHYLTSLELAPGTATELKSAIAEATSTRYLAMRVSATP